MPFKDYIGKKMPRKAMNQVCIGVPGAKSVPESSLHPIIATVVVVEVVALEAAAYPL